MIMKSVKIQARFLHEMWRTIQYTVKLSQQSYRSIYNIFSLEINFAIPIAHLVQLKRLNQKSYFSIHMVLEVLNIKSLRGNQKSMFLQHSFFMFKVRLV